MREKGSHANLSDGGYCTDCRLYLHTEFRFQGAGQFTRHLKPQGVHPHVRRFSLSDFGFHTLRKDLTLTQNPGNMELRLMEALQEALSQNGPDFHVSMS